MASIVVLPVGSLQTNCYVVSQGGVCAVVDPGGESQRIFQELKSRGLVCEGILLTHGHRDHTGGLEALKKATGAPVYMGVGDASLSPIPPDVLCRQGDTVLVGELAFQVLETPGHTPGCVCYQLGDTLFSGDTLFRDSVGRTDLSGGDFATLRESLCRLRDLPLADARVLPGHGEETTLDYERRNNPFIERASR